MYKKGFKNALPVMMGYFPIAIAFGVMANSAGVGLSSGVLMSALVYAGASQFMAIGMLSSGITFSSIILGTVLMNFRHFIMSASLRTRVSNLNKKWYPIVGFFLTDETFSVAMMQEDIDDPQYLITLEISCYSSWVLGTLVGYLSGSFFPDFIVESMGIALYALFLALLIPACKKSKVPIILAVSSGVLNTLFVKYKWLNSSVGFVVSVILISVVAGFVKEYKKEVSQ